MRRFAALVDALEVRSAKLDPQAALLQYLEAAPAADAAWALHLLAGGKLQARVPLALLRQLACQAARIDETLFDESQRAVGDLAETIALVWPASPQGDGEGLAACIEQQVLPLHGLDAAAQASRLRRALDTLDAGERFVFVRLVSGGLRLGVSPLLLQRALARHAGLDLKLMAQRWRAWTAQHDAGDVERYLQLLAPAATGDGAAGLPHPFMLAQPLRHPPYTLGEPSDWLVEWKYDGVRAQLVRRGGGAWIWTRDDALLNDRLPEISAAAGALPEGCVLDGELLLWPPDESAPRPLGALRQRLARKTLTRKLLAETPVCFVVFDLLEQDGADLRSLPQHERRGRLQQLPLPGPLRRSPLLAAHDWAALASLRAQSRQRGVEGLVLKQRQASYGHDPMRSEGPWWTWKIDPLALDAVLIYAQAGPGRRAGAHTEYTFALWNRPPASAAEAQAAIDAIAQRLTAPPGALQLVPVAKVASGLGDAELAALEDAIRAHTLHRFGPVRSLRPTLVVAIAFDTVVRSARHKSGVAVQQARMLGIRHDKPLHEADSLQALQGLVGGG